MGQRPDARQLRSDRSAGGGIRGLGAAHGTADARREPVRQPRFTAASASVAISFFALSGFIFLVTQMFQFLKGYGPLSTGVRLLPVASFVAISSILGTKLAVRFGTKLIVASGLFLMTAFYLWVSTSSVTTGYGTIAAQMVVLGTGMGLTSTPRDRGDHGRRPESEGRYRVGGQRRHTPFGRHPRRRRDRQRVRLVVRQPAHERAPGGLPAGVVRNAHASVGAALTVASKLTHAGHPLLASAIHNAANSAFFRGFHAANYVPRASPPQAA